MQTNKIQLMMIKLDVLETDNIFTCDENGHTIPDQINNKLLVKTIQEVITNCGYPEYGGHKIDKVYDCFNEATNTDEHGDKYIRIADCTVTFADQSTELFQFVMLM